MALDSDRLPDFAAALEFVWQAIDWTKLGNEYCESGGEHFFEAESTAAIQDAGLRFAGDLGSLLKANGPQRSLYVGFGIAEVPVMLFETIMLEREVDAYTLVGFEPNHLRQTLQNLKDKLHVRIPKLSVKPLPASPQPCVDHLWLASVCTDPEAFPAIHDRLYERTGSPLATGKGHFEKERAKALDLLQKALTWVAPPATITTSREELHLFQKALGPVAGQLLIPDQARLSAIVGDPILHCNWAP